MAVKDLVRKVKGFDTRDAGTGRGNDLSLRSHENRDFGLSPLGGLDLLPQFHREMNRLFESFFGDQGRDWGLPSLWSGTEGWTRTFNPNIDIRDNGQEIKVVAELPGIDEKDLDVELTGDHLIIRGEKREESDEKDKEGWRRVERRFGSFERMIALPAGIDVDKVKADFRKGVLTVSVPRRPEAQVERRKITVETGTSETSRAAETSGTDKKAA